MLPESVPVFSLLEYHTFAHRPPTTLEETRVLQCPSHLQGTHHIKQQICLRSHHLCLANQDNLAVVESEPVIAFSRIADVVPGVDLALVYDDAREFVVKGVCGRVDVVV